jgi:hypothetical protein
MDGTNLGTSAVIATLLVPVISLVKRPSWNPKAVHALSLVAALLAAVIGTVVDNKPANKAEFIASLGTAFTASQVVYAQFFSGTSMNEKLSNI